MPEKILGLDIGDRSVKAVQVAGGLKACHVTACARVEIAQGEGIEDALKVLFEKIPFDTGACIASFPGNRVSYRNLSMPFGDKKKIGQTIGYELEPMLPFSPEAITTDYIVTERSEETKILSASVRQEALAQYLSDLTVHNIDPDVVDISGVPTAIQLAKQEDGPADALVIDIGSRGTVAILFIRHTVVLVRFFCFGGDVLTDAIAESENLDHIEAEQLKCGGGVEGLDEAVRPVVRSFCKEIHNTLHAFRCEVMKEAHPEKVYVTGGGALCPSMATILEDSLGLPVELVDLAQQGGVDVDIEEDASGQWNPLLMNSALALALRDTKDKDGFNFRQGQFKKKKRNDQFRREIKRIATYAGVILIALVANISVDYYVLHKRHNHLQGEITSVFKKTFPDVQRIVDPVQQMKVKIREAKDSMLLPAESLVQRAAVDVLRDIAVHIPEKAKVDFSSLIIDEERVRLKGHTDTFNTVDEVKNGLQESAFFKDVAIASAQLDRTGDRVRFELVMGRR